ncbi:putative ABC transporter [Seiridium cardinale]
MALHRVSPGDEIQLAHLVISVCFLVSLPFRIWTLRNSSPKTAPNTIGLFKAILSLLLPLLHIVQLFETGGWLGAPGFVNVATPVASVVAAIGYCILSPLEHKRSIRPSTPILLFLAAFLVSDTAQWALVTRDGRPNRGFAVAGVATLLDLILLIVESSNKHQILLDRTAALSPEDTAGALSKSFFWWINSVLAEGYHTILQDDNLPRLDSSLSSTSLRKTSLRVWEQRGKPESSMTLPKILLKILLRPFLGAILPRLFLTVFRYSQPLLIREAIRFLTAYSTEAGSTDGFNIIAAAVIIYVGLAVSAAAYQRCLNRLSVMTRGVLVSLIHHKTLNTSSDILSEGKVVTLMSNDVDSLSDVAGMFHETWAQVLEVAVGLALLASEVGWLWPLPIVFIFFSSRVSQYVARNLRGRQGAWNAATQSRISMISAVLSTIKNIKMLGLQASMISYIERLRCDEIKTAGRVRWMMVAYNASANALGIFAPVITLVLYATIAGLNGTGLDAETAFTTTAILGMVTHPANMVMTIVPRAVASFSSFERIQKFLLDRDRVDLRIKGPTAISTGGDNHQDCVAISAQDVSVETSGSKLLLQDITFEIPTGRLYICAGPTASGKTTLARAILGEISTSGGTVSVRSKRIGYCAQTAWLPSTTIEAAILSYSRTQEVDQGWYTEVLRACCLEQDLASMPNSDKTLVGSKGMNLSGGQKQRIALARALYARPDIMLLDDTLSGLDGRTENQVVENLFGPGGLIHKLGTTVFLITNAVQHFHLADRILVLENFRIKEQGSWGELQTKQQQIEKIITKSEGDVSKESDQAPSSLQKPAKSVRKDISKSSRSEGDSSLYGYYFKYAGYANLVLLVAPTAVLSFCINFPQYWLKLWTESDNSATWLYMAGYIIIALTAWCATNGTAWSTSIRIAPHSGLALHSKLLNTVLRAPLSYFSKTETGEILNRFSQDIQLVDKQLASAVSTLCVQICKLTVQVVLLFLASKYTTFTLPLCCVVVYVVQKVYLRTSRQLRILELESRSAVFNDFLQTVDGVMTIRAFQAQDQAEVNHLEYLEISQRPFYLLFCLQRWLKIVLDLLVAGVGVGVIVTAVTLRGTTTGSQIGIALNMILVTNTTLLALVSSWTNLEISLGAISRLKSLEEDVLPEDQEADKTDAYIGKPWPEPGVVELKSITAAYNPEVVALRDFSLQVDAGQLVVICGRTGRGKSSVLLSLLKLIDVKAGSVIVHGLNTMHAPTSVVREKFFVTIPQDPMLFNQASLRFNLDTSETLGSDRILEVLERVQLSQHFQISNADNVGVPPLQDEGSTPVLDKMLSELPTLSAGQAQLLALGRALLQAYSIAESGYKPIILLDEATSSLDADAERLMLSIISEEFTLKGYTVIMVAHRLGAVKAMMRDGIDKMVEM